MMTAKPRKKFPAPVCPTVVEAKAISGRAVAVKVRKDYLLHLAMEIHRCTNDLIQGLSSAEEDHPRGGLPTSTFMDLTKDLARLTNRCSALCVQASTHTCSAIERMDEARKIVTSLHKGEG